MVEGNLGVLSGEARQPPSITPTTANPRTFFSIGFIQAYYNYGG
jgi:hypothetical protein